MSVQLLEKQEANLYTQSNNPINTNEVSLNELSSMNFKDFLSQEEASQLKAEDYKQLEYIYKVFTRQTAIELNCKEGLAKIKDEAEKIENLGLPLQMKEKMLQSVRETLITLIRKLEESKKFKSELILSIEKNNNYSVYLGLIQKWKDGNELGTSPSASSKSVKSHPVNKNTNGNSSTNASNGQNGKDSSYKSRLESARQENIRLEDAITFLKVERNNLIMNLDNQRDDLMEYQSFVDNKRVMYEQKCRYVEQLKHEISLKNTKKAQKSNNMLSKNSLLSVFKSKKPKGALSERSISKMNTTVFQDVSSKVTGFIGKVFNNKKGGKGVSKDTDNIILTPDFLKELNMTSDLRTEASPERTTKGARYIR